jgi:hypothetical protein
MALSKVANLIQKNLGNLTGGGLAGIAGGVVGSLMDKARNSIQTNAAAAKILNKSPLEINDTSPTAHMKSNPYQYGTVYYPSDIQNLGTGHYMLFDIIVNDHTTYQNATFKNNKINPNKVTNRFLGQDIDATAIGGTFTGAITRQKGFTGRVATLKENGVEQSRITNLSSGIQRNKGFGIKATHNMVTDTVVLYTPKNLKTTYLVNHEGTETGMLGNLAGVDFTSPGDIVSRLKESGTQFLTEVAAMGLAVVPGAGDLKALMTRTTGRAFNNNLEMVFKGVPMREFSYEFEFAPRNRKELDAAQKIINLFKFHMHPELGSGNDFITPSEFQITYMYMENRNSYIPRISRCVLTSLDLTHGAENVFSTFAGDELGAAPIYTKMELKFSETEIMTKKTIAEGF